VRAIGNVGGFATRGAELPARRAGLAMQGLRRATGYRPRMNRWLVPLLDLFRLRAGPQDLPHAPALLAGLGIAIALMEFFSARGLGLEPGQTRLVFAQLVLAAVLLLLVPWLLLTLAKHPARFVQTAIALLITHVGFTLIALVLIKTSGLEVALDPENISAPQWVAMWLMLALLAWKLLVHGSIYRHALGVPLKQGVLLAVALLMLELMLTLLLVAGEAA